MQNDKTIALSDKQLLYELNRLVVDCKELSELEKVLAKFNVYRVLKFEFGELQHSNTLAWLMQPSESHGLSDLFLRKFLMKVLLDSNASGRKSVMPIAVDSMKISEVSVYREWRNIDLVIVIETSDNDRWLVVIENKVNAVQRPNQLTDYRERVEDSFDDVGNKLFIFLTKNNEPPDDDQYLSANYEQVRDVLRDCLDERRDVIGVEPLVLISHYLEIISEVFMENAQIAKIARQIYAKHRIALDTIFEHRPDALVDLTTAVSEKIQDVLNKNSYIQIVTSKGYVRFIPKIWDVESNRVGRAWGKTNSAFILFEVSLELKTLRLNIVVGNPPLKWGTRLIELSQKKPFAPSSKTKKPTTWFNVHSSKSNITPGDLEDADIDKLSQTIVDWVDQNLTTPETQEIIKQIADTFPLLEEELETQ